MNKKLLAVAVAGALAAPAAALAQSSVTISGYLYMTVDNIKIDNAATARTGRKSEGRLNDESSRITFDVREDLGGGNTALVHVETSPNADAGLISVTGASWIGFSTKTAGRFTAGRHNFHFFKTPYDGYGLGSGLKTLPTSLIDWAGGGAVAIANSTRTANSLMWSSPKWGGFAMDAGYSFSPLGAGSTEADLTAGNTARKGRAWTLNPTFGGQNWHIAYSYWNSRADAPVAAQQLAQADQRSDSIYGFYTWGGFKLGAMWNNSKLNAATAGGLGGVGTNLSKRTAWSIPIRYTTGPHNFLAHYTKARDDKATAAQDGAKMWAFTYAYTLSKRTLVSLNYAKITNDASATYDLFTSGRFGVLGSVNATPLAGEDPRLISLGMRHNF